MSRTPSRAATAIRILADVTIALYLVVVTLLVLTFAFPRWGEDPHPVRQPGDDFSFYLPPQFTAAVFVGLFAFALATLLGMICIVSSAAERPSWVVGLQIVTGLAVQGPILIATDIYFLHGSLDPVLEAVSVIASVLAYLLLPVLAQVSTRRATSGR